MRIKTILFRFIGFAIFIYLLVWVVGVRELLRVLAAMKPAALVAVIPFHLCQWTLRVLRWRILLENERIHLRFSETFAVATSGFFLGCLTPGRVGEFAKVKFLMNAGYSLRSAFLSSLIERLLDLAAVMFFVLLGILICLPLFVQSVSFYVPSILSLGMGCVLLYVLRGRMKTLIVRLIPETIAAGMESKIDAFMDSLRIITGRQWTIILFESLAVWVLNYWMIYLLFRGAGFSLPVHYAFAFAGLGSFAGLIPAFVYGVGIREPLLIGLFTQLNGEGDAATAGLVFSLMFMVLLVYHIVLGLLWWLSPAMKRFLSSGRDSV